MKLCMLCLLTAFTYLVLLPGSFNFVFSKSLQISTVECALSTSESEFYIWMEYILFHPPHTHTHTHSTPLLSVFIVFIYSHCDLYNVSCYLPLKGGWEFLMSSPCLESQGCQFDPTLAFIHLYSIYNLRFFLSIVF